MRPKIVKCRSCGAEIVWAITERGKRIPLNAEPDNAKGNIVIALLDEMAPTRGGGMEPMFSARTALGLMNANEERYMPHHAVCPQAKQWRR